MKKKKYQPLASPNTANTHLDFVDSVRLSRKPRYPFSSFRFKNLKSWKDSKELNFKRINLVYGENSSGKSSLLQSILLTNEHLYDLVYGSESRFSTLGNIENIRFVSNTYDLGSFNHSIHATRKKNESNGITFIFSTKMEGSGEITLSFTYKDDQGSGTLDSFNIKFSEVRLVAEDFTRNEFRHGRRRRAKSKQNSVIRLNGLIKGKLISKRVSKDILGVEKKGYKLDLSRLSYELDKTSRANSAYGKYSIPEYDFIIYHDLIRDGVITAKNKAKTAKTYTSEMFRFAVGKRRVDQNLEMISEIIRTSLRLKPRGDVIHIPPIRGIPPRNSDLTLLTDADPSVAYIYRCFTKSRFIRRPARRRNITNKLQEDVNKVLHSFGSHYSVDLLSGEHQALGSTYTNIILNDQRKRLTLLDVGRGISQILPIIVASLAEERRTILVEQPEVHIHPKLQADLADLFIESPNQWIVESHSENIILRMQRRIREGLLNHEEIKLFYIVEGNQGAEFIEIDFLADGNLSRNFPKGFFDVGIEELLS